MDVADHNLVFAFIIRLDFSHAERNKTSFTIGDELETASFNDLTNTLVELECGCWVTLNLDSEVASLI